VYACQSPGKREADECKLVVEGEGEIEKEVEGSSRARSAKAEISERFQLERNVGRKTYNQYGAESQKEGF
jgi:hypothetical protein